MGVLIKNLLPAIRARLLMVSWVDRGLDLEGGGWGGGAEEGEVIMQLKWLGNGRCPRFGSGGGQTIGKKMVLGGRAECNDEDVTESHMITSQRGGNAHLLCRIM